MKSGCSEPHNAQHIHWAVSSLPCDELGERPWATGTRARSHKRPKGGCRLGECRQAGRGTRHNLVQHTAAGGSPRLPTSSVPWTCKKPTAQISCERMNIRDLANLIARVIIDKINVTLNDTYDYPQVDLRESTAWQTERYLELLPKSVMNSREIMRMAQRPEAARILKIWFTSRHWFCRTNKKSLNDMVGEIICLAGRRPSALNRCKTVQWTNRRISPFGLDLSNQFDFDDMDDTHRQTIRMTYYSIYSNLFMEVP